MGRTENFEGPDMLAFQAVRKYLDKRYGRVDKGQNHGMQRRLVTESKLIWAGKHYLMIHEGPYEGTRDIMLYNRAQVFLKEGNPHKNAMLEIALATLDEQEKLWAVDFSQRLWHSGKYGGGVEGLRHLRGQRFSKKLIAGCVEFAEEQDRTHDERFEAFKALRAGQNAFAQSVGNLLLEQGLTVKGIDPKSSGRKTKPFKRFIADRVFHVTMLKEREFKFKVQRDQKIEITWNEAVSKEEFEIIAKAVAEVSRLRRSRQPEAPQEVSQSRSVS